MRAIIEPKAPPLHGGQVACGPYVRIVERAQGGVWTPAAR
jgi:hypothetical protein